MKMPSRMLIARCSLILLLVACSAGTGEPDGTSAAEVGGVCQGSYGHTKAADGQYFISAFGCWVDAAGGKHGDSGDNCIPACLSQARAAGLCTGSGKQCEESVTWYVADAARFGCLAHVRVTNPANGKSVIAVALDYGPGCRVENSVSKPVLDASGRINRYLFGADQGSSDRTRVSVEPVGPDTPLGPDLGSSASGAPPSASPPPSAPPAGRACHTDGDCNPGNDGSGEICSAGTCVPGCKTNAQCPGSTTCVRGQCG